MAAEVGLLSRNIRIEGADYDRLFQESYGGRVLVGRFSQAGQEYKGIMTSQALSGRLASTPCQSSPLRGGVLL